MIPCYRPFFDHRELLATAKPGSSLNEFEEATAGVLGANYGLAFPQGRVAFRALLQSLEIKNAEVILPAMTCETMVTATLLSGNTPVFADINLSDFCLDLDSLSSVLSSRTRVVVATHMLGYRSDVAGIKSRVGSDRILIVEDFAQYLHPRVGKLEGDAGILSFGKGKPISTVSGGMTVTVSPQIYEKVRSFRETRFRPPTLSQSRGKIIWLLGSYILGNRTLYGLWQRVNQARQKSVPNLPFLEVDSRSITEDLMPADFQARIGLQQLEKLPEIFERRFSIARELTTGLGGHPEITIPPSTETAAYVRFPILINRRAQLDFTRRMRRLGVIVGETSEYCNPFRSQFKAYGQGSYPQALEAFEKSVELPIFPGLRQRELKKVISAVERALKT